MHRQLKGFWYMIESILTATIVISFLIVLGSSVFVPTYSEDMSVSGHRILRDLAQKDSFRARVYLDDQTGIMNEIDIPGYYYNISICNDGGTCNGFDPMETNSTVWTSSYIFTGRNSYENKVLRLYVWR